MLTLFTKAGAWIGGSLLGKIAKSRIFLVALSAGLTFAYIYHQGKSSGERECAEARVVEAIRDSDTMVELAAHSNTAAERRISTELEIDDAHRELVAVLQSEEGLAGCRLSDDGRLRINRALERIAGTD